MKRIFKWCATMYGGYKLHIINFYQSNVHFVLCTEIYQKITAVQKIVFQCMTTISVGIQKSWFAWNLPLCAHLTHILERVFPAIDFC